MELGPSSSILIIGCGKMGEAILSGWLASEEGSASSLSPDNFCIIEHADRATEIADTYGVDVKDGVETVSTPDVILLAVKPQSFGDVLPSIKDRFFANAGEPAPLIVSIAAGIPSADIERALSSNARVVRVMPNLPLQVGAGASVVCAGKNASGTDVELVRDLFSTLGFASIVDEDKIDAVCAISGGGPAYFAYMVELLADAGVEAGLDADLSYELAASTLYGTGLVLHEKDIDAAELRRAVCSPGGTTLAALAKMDEHGIKEAIQAGVDGAIARAEELSKC